MPEHLPPPVPAVADPPPQSRRSPVSSWPLRTVWWATIALSRMMAGALARRGADSQRILETLWPIRAAIERLQCRGTVVEAGGAKFLYSSDDLINLKLAMIGCHEFDTTHAVKTRLLPSDVFVDVGANLGYFAVLAGKQTPTGRVIAIEPSPRNFAALQMNVALNGLQNVTCAQKILWSESGKEISLHVVDPYNRGANSVLGQGQVDTVLTSLTLDDLLEELGVHHVDAMKIDVEGAELDVLKGAERTLHVLRPRLIVLALDHPLEPVRRQSFDMLAALGYQETDPFTRERRPPRDVLGYSCVFLERTH